uniref:Uncharacterized protein n=1 Tax=Rhizophora mucronata TaxID=61149 RepID=A0A2P2N4D1_RHIMU
MMVFDSWQISQCNGSIYVSEWSAAGMRNFVNISLSIHLIPTLLTLLRFFKLEALNAGQKMMVSFLSTRSHIFFSFIML